MNRDDRRAAHLIVNWPMLPPGELPILPGRPIHLVVQHDDWCRTLNGGTWADCNCRPTMSAHLQPKDITAAEHGGDE